MGVQQCACVKRWHVGAGHGDLLSTPLILSSRRSHTSSQSLIRLQQITANISRPLWMKNTPPSPLPGHPERLDKPGAGMKLREQALLPRPLSKLLLLCEQNDRSWWAVASRRRTNLLGVVGLQCLRDTCGVSTSAAGGRNLEQFCCRCVLRCSLTCVLEVMVLDARLRFYLLRRGV